MEHRRRSQSCTSVVIDVEKEAVDTDHINAGGRNKRGGGMQFFQLARFMLRRRSGKSKSTVEAITSSKGTWKRLVGSMRPFHLQSSNHSSPPPRSEGSPLRERYEDVLPPPMSPSSSDGGMSQYASAVNLQELDKTNDDDKDNSVFNGDNQIDAKAEEFIAQFYQQMKLQRMDSMHRRSHKIIRRSIG